VFGFSGKVLRLDGQRVDIDRGGIRLAGKHTGQRHGANAIPGTAQKLSAREWLNHS
jgi:hypothetical protein